MSIQLIHAFGDASHDGVLAVNEFGRITFANDIAANALDCKREELLNQFIDDILHFESTEAASARSTWAAARAKHGCRGRLVRRDGVELPIRFNVVPLPRDSQLPGAIIAFQNVATHRDALEAEVNALEANLQENTVREDDFPENPILDKSLHDITHYFNKRHDNMLDTSSNDVQKNAVPRDDVEHDPIEEGPASAADVDQVTGLMNRSCFQSVLEQEMQDAVRSNGSGGLLYIDLDDFYAVNDAFGHHVGDDVLRHVSHVLQDIMPAGAIVARVGGDEFGVLLPHTSAEEAVAAGRRMLTALNEPATCGTEPIYVRASIGVATFSHDADTASPADDADAADDLLMRAHSAMRAAKQSGGQRVVPYTSALDCHAIRKVFEWDRRCRAALRNDRFVLYRQPLIDVTTRHVVAWELLLRMLGDDDELIMPGQFLPTCEQTGLIVQLDQWVIRKAFQLLVKWPALRDDTAAVHINLSRRTLSDEGLFEFIKSEAELTGIDPRRVVFEVTETAAIENVEQATQFMNDMQQLGFRFALDDFGVGFSALGALRVLPVHFLKIDGSFVRDLRHDPVNQHVVQAVIELARGLGKQTVAEFVPDEQTLEMLRQAGANIGQGYYLGRPEPIPDVEHS